MVYSHHDCTIVKGQGTSTIIFTQGGDKRAYKQGSMLTTNQVQAVYQVGANMPAIVINTEQAWVGMGTDSNTSCWHVMTFDLTCALM